MNASLDEYRRSLARLALGQRGDREWEALVLRYGREFCDDPKAEPALVALIEGEPLDRVNAALQLYSLLVLGAL